MPKFAANLSMLFGEAPFLDRFAAAKRAGFEAVEYLFPYDFSKADLRDRLDAAGLKQVLFNLPAGNWQTGERGIACHPNRIGEFQDGVAKAVDYAQALNCPTVNCLAGIVPQGLDPAQAEETLIANLRFAAEQLAQAGVLLVAEPVNSYDIPGFSLTRSAQAIALFDKVGSDNLKLQYDIYHMQRMEGELATTLERLLPRIGHVQLADNPGRNEPGAGEINFDFLFAHLDRIGYRGWIGCEYKPLASTEAGLAWLKRARR